MVAQVFDMDTFLPRHLWEDLVGLPFVCGGRGPDAYDCFGLVMKIYQRRGIIIPDCYYGDDAVEQARLLTQGQEGWLPCPRGPGAVCLWRSWRSTAPAHVGVMINQDLYIHATEDLGQVALNHLSRSPNIALMLGTFIPPDSYERVPCDAV